MHIVQVYGKPWTWQQRSKKLVALLERNGFELTKFGKGSHRRYKHSASGVSVTIPGKDSDDAKIYLEKQVQKALKDVATGRGGVILPGTRRAGTSIP